MLTLAVKLVACIMLTLAVKDKPFTKYARSGTDRNIMTVFFEGPHFGRIQILNDINHFFVAHSLSLCKSLFMFLNASSLLSQ